MRHSHDVNRRVIVMLDGSPVGTIPVTLKPKARRLKVNIYSGPELEPDDGVTPGERAYIEVFMDIELPGDGSIPERVKLSYLPDYERIFDHEQFEPI